MIEAVRQRGELRVVHSLPGRVRLRLEPGDDPGDLYAWEQRLRAAPGVLDVGVNPAARSLRVLYDEQTFDPLVQPGILPPAVVGGAGTPAAARDAGEEFRAEPSSRLAQSIMHGFWKTDAAISNWTGHWMDLKLAIPMGFLTAGIWELMIGEAFTSVTFQVLAWYSYNVFVHLHSREFHPRVRGEQ